MNGFKGYVYLRKKGSNRLPKFVPAVVEWDNGMIMSVKQLEEDELSSEEKEHYMIPGLVDIHSHGCFGHDTCDADEEGLLAMLDFEHSRGTTSYCPTTMTVSTELLEKVCENVGKVAKKSPVIKGVYLEGPFISKEKCGAQDPQYIIKADLELVKKLDKLTGGLVKVVAIAPETEGAIDFIRGLKGKYKASIAHTAAKYDIAAEAMKNGAKHVTHFYNAMPPYSHREPGVVGAAMDRKDVKVELIADGIHVHPCVVRNTFRAFGPKRVILISDSMEATGLCNGTYSLGGQKVFVTGRKATLENGTIAGSASTLYDCLCEAVKMGVPREQAILSATETPAREIGIFDRVGSIEEGKASDLLIITKDMKLEDVIS